MKRVIILELELDKEVPMFDDIVAGRVYTIDGVNASANVTVLTHEQYIEHHGKSKD